MLFGTESCVGTPLVCGSGQRVWALAEIVRVDVAEPSLPRNLVVTVVVANVEAQVCRVSPGRLSKRIGAIGDCAARARENSWIMKPVARVRRRHNHNLRPGFRQSLNALKRHGTLRDRRAWSKMLCSEDSPVAIEAHQYSQCPVPPFQCGCPAAGIVPYRAAWPTQPATSSSPAKATGLSSDIIPLLRGSKRCNLAPQRSPNAHSQADRGDIWR